MNNYLNIPEELFLLSINNAYGTTANMNTIAFQLALSGAILMELSLREKIDTDVERLIIADTESTESEELDMALNMMRIETGDSNVNYWITRLNEQHQTFVDVLLNSLIRKKILKIENKKVLWMFETLKYPLVNKAEVKDVKSRIKELIMSDELPELHDMVIVSLLHYSGLFHLVMSKRESKRYEERIEMIAKMDVLGQNIGQRLKMEIDMALEKVKTDQALF